MYRIIVLTCAIAMTVGCANSRKKLADQRKPLTPIADKTTDSGGAWPSAAPTTQPSFAVDRLTGAWNLAMPRSDQQPATITAIDATRVRIDAGEELSGDYLLQGEFLLILTTDERMRPLAWHINSPDSLTVVRSAQTDDGGFGFTGFTLLRAASESQTADAGVDDAEASANTAGIDGQ